MTTPQPVNGSCGHSTFVDELPPVPGIPRPRESSVSIDVPLGELLSPSQANSYLECPAKWWFHYGVELPDPKGSALAIGTAVDNALSHYFRVKAADGVALPESEVIEAADASWARQQEETLFRPGEDPAALGELARRLVSCYLQEKAPQVNAALIDGKPAVQVPVSGKIAGVRVHGIVDLIAEDGTIIDLKTKKDKPGFVPADHMLQIATYTLLSPHARGKAEIHYMVKGRAKPPKPQFVPFSCEIGAEDVALVETIYPAVQESIRNRVHPPRRMASFCSRRYCAFWQACEKEFGGKVAP